MPETKEWTVMFYFASDNPLAPGTIAQLKAIKNAGYQKDTNVIAQFDPHTVNLPVHVFDVNMVEKLKYPGKSNIGFTGNDPFVRNLVLDKLWDGNIREEIQRRTAGYFRYEPPVPDPAMSKEQNPKESLEAFLKFCSKEYPARHYILFIIGHGIIVGNDLFMYDEHAATPDTGNGDSKEESDPPQCSLLLTDLGKILKDFKDEATGQFELIGFHSCSMSGVEVALQLQGTANYMLASQGPAYVGSWPYRQILIRLFNDLEADKLPSDYLIAKGLIDVVKSEADPVSKYLHDRINSNGSEANQASTPDRKLVHALAQEFDNLHLLEEGRLREEAVKRLGEDRVKLFKDEDPKSLNRRLLVAVYDEEVKRVTTKSMLKKIFHYYMYNSFDFQLAGYSSDLALCDLNKTGDLQTPLDNLAGALIKALDQEDAFIRDAIVLAHWEAQSFYEENYTDLYDFCFLLRKKLNPQQDSEKILTNITDACDAVTALLEKRSWGDDDGLILRSEFCGPEYQYSHGLSVFFPWSEPVANPMWDDQYGRYTLNQQDSLNKKESVDKEKDICWKKFLKTYFDKTMRLTEQEEQGEPEVESRQSNLDADLLTLLQTITSRAFADGQLGSGGPRDPMGNKGGGLDPTGGDCECGSIKNHPHRTGRIPSQNGGSAANRKPQSVPAMASPGLLRRITNQLTSDPEETLLEG